jgi:tetratricopeptide (TPR) repeat protein
LGRIVFPHFPGHWLRLQGNSSPTNVAFHQVLYGYCRFFRIDYLRHAITLRPDSAPAQFQVFALEAATGHLEEARAGFEKMVKQWPDFVEAHLQLALVYARLHQTQQSERQQQIVVELNEKARAAGPQPEATP